MKVRASGSSAERLQHAPHIIRLERGAVTLQWRARHRQKAQSPGCDTMDDMTGTSENRDTRQTVDFNAARQTADEVIAAMFAIPDGEQRFPRGWWPGGCCENAATAIAGVLADRRLGDWLLVSGKRPGQTNGHMWLEFRDATGATLYSIDVTLHQMPEFDEPFMGEGVSPAAEVFTEHREAYSLLDWPWLGDENAPFRANLRQVRAILQK